MDTQRITNFLFEIASMRRIKRNHGQVIPNVEENIGDHSFRVAVIGMILAKLENVDENKVLKMCLFHDVAEARTGDANFINKQYVQQAEREARQDQMKGLPIESEMLEIFQEYEARKTHESLVAKDADTLDQLVLEQEHFRNDPENKKVRHEYTMGKLKTASAQKLAPHIASTNPFTWLYQLGKEKAGIDL